MKAVTTSVLTLTNIYKSIGQRYVIPRMRAELGARALPYGTRTRPRKRDSSPFNRKGLTLPYQPRAVGYYLMALSVRFLLIIVNNSK